MRGLFLAVGLVLAGPTAAAQPSIEAPAKRAQPSSEAPAKKQNWVAQMTSLGATWGTVTVGFAIAGDDAEGVRGDVGVSLVLAGLTLGPTAGHWYVGDELITTGLCIRLGAFAAIPTLMIFDPYLNRPSVSGPVIGAASLAFVTGMIWDHVALQRAVRRHNGPTLVPVVTPSGVALAGTF